MYLQHGFLVHLSERLSLSRTGRGIRCRRWQSQRHRPAELLLRVFDLAAAAANNVDVLDAAAVPAAAAETLPAAVPARSVFVGGVPSGKFHEGIFVR